MKEENLKEVVKRVLEKDQINRDSDNWLIVNVLRELGCPLKFDIDAFCEMPSIESITRARRHIQNIDGELLPSEEIKEQREKRELEIRRFYCDLEQKYPTSSKYIRDEYAPLKIQ